MSARLAAIACLALLVGIPLPASGQTTFPSGDIVLERVYVGTPVVGRPIIVEARVYNDGAQDALVSVRYGWNSPARPLQGDVPVAGPETVPAKGRLSFNFTWTPDATQVGQGFVYAKIDSSVPQDANPGNSVNFAEAFVRQYKINLSMEGFVNVPRVGKVPEPGTAGHPQVVAFAFRVQNLGNVADVANVSVVPDATEPAWAINVTRRFFALAPHESVETFVVLQAPWNATNETPPRAAQLLATSEGYRSFLPEDEADSPGAQQSSTLTTPSVEVVDEAETNFSVLAEGPSGILFMRAGANATTTVRITNKGQAPDIYNVTANASGDLAGIRVESAERALNASALQVFLGPGASRTLTFNVSAPASLQADLNATINVSVASMNWKAATAHATRLVRPEAADLVIDEIVPVGSVFRGVPATLVVKGHNRGNLPVADVPLSLKILRQGAWSNVTNASLTLESDGLSSWSRNVPFDTDALSGRYLLEARLDPDDQRLDPNRTKTAFVAEVFVHAVDLALQAPGNVSAAPSERVAFGQAGPGFYVTNRGNHDEMVELRLGSAHGLFTASATKLVRVGETVSIPIDFAVPARPLTANDTIHAEARVFGADRVFASASVQLAIVDRARPVLQLALPADARVGEPFAIVATITAATPIGAAYATVAFPTGAVQRFPLTSIGSDRFSAQVTPEAAGVLGVSIHAADTAQPPNENDTDVRTLVVLPRASLPQISFVQPKDGARVGAGATATWSVQNATTVEYAIDDEPRMQAKVPYSIDLDPLPEGPHRITVFATDADGDRATATLSITKDTTPPQITDVKVRRLGGNLVEVTVTTDRDATSGFVLAEPSGVRVTLEGKDTLVGTIDAADAKRLKVGVQDEAGNVAVRDLDVPSSLLPFTGLPLVIALVLALALARRRRG